MAGDFDSLLTLGERQRFDAALQKLAGTPEPEMRRGTGPSERATRRPTSYEERIWLAQQQQPEALKHVVAFRLSGDLDLARLALAIEEVVRACPNLNARYRFDEDGELHKQLACDDSQPLRVLRVDTLEEAIGHVLARQAASFDSERDPPCEALVLAGPRETILALILHRILDEACPAAELLRGIAQAYGRNPIDILARPERDDLQTTAAPSDEHDAMLPDWARRSPAGPRPAILDQTGSTWPAPTRAMAARHAASIGGEALGAGSPDADQDRALLARLAAQFARFVSALSGRQEIGLLVRPPQGAQSGEGGPLVAGGGWIGLVVDGQAPAEATSRDILGGLARAGADPASRSGRADARRRPTVRVSWLAEPAELLPIAGVSVRRLALPTPEPQPDLALAVGRDAEGGLTLELTTGQELSPAVGPFLLERFVAWIADPRTALPGPAALPGSAPARTDLSAGRSDTPADAITALILDEFREALGAPQMGADDDFFDHGGHSLIATRIIGRLLGRHGVELHFNDLFSHPSAAALARKARRAQISGEEPARETAEEAAASAPLSLAQMSLWKAYAAFGFNEIFNLPFALDFLEPVDEELFARAFGDVLERHPGLRSLFREEGGEVRQVVVPVAELPRYKWFWPSRESEGLDRRDEARHHFELARELPFRLRFLIDPATGRQVLSFLFHHIVLDEWSVNLMMDEIGYCYRMRAAGGLPVWSDAPPAFDAFARLQKAAGVDATHVGYWADALRGAPKPQPILPRKADGSPDGTQASAAGGWVELKLNRQTSEGLYALARQNSASLFNVVYAGIAAALRQLGSLSELVIGTSASGRSDAAFFDTVGYFTTVVAHRIRFDDGMSLGELVGRVKNTINESMPYTEIPIDLVEEALGMTPGRDHLFEVFIQIHAKNKLNGVLELPGGGTIAYRQVDPDRHESMLGLHFEVMEETLDGERSIRVLMSYRSEHYGPQEVERIRATTGAVFALMAEQEASRLRLDALAARLPQG